MRHGDEEGADALQRSRGGQTEPIPPEEIRRGVAGRALCFSFLSVVANTTVAEASQLLVIQALVPFSTHSSPS